MHFHVMKSFLKYPDLMIYLRVSPETALSRIQARNRSEEQGKVPLSYLQALHKGYEDFIEEMRNYAPVLILDWEEYIPVEKVALMVESIQQERLKKFRHLGSFSVI